MTSLVKQLQKDTLDNSIKISDILRKALLIAKKLKIEEFEQLVSKELKGYEAGDKIPDYRLLNGKVMVLNPYHGYQPVFFLQMN
jgi:hypothetical protein